MVEPATDKIDAADPSVELPELFPTQNVSVSDEKHRFETFQTADEIEPKVSYQLDKAPIQRITRVVGTYDGSTIEFTKGVDYTLSGDNENIVWQPGERSPDPGTFFSVNYVSDSILKRYIASAEDELDVTQDAIVAGINNKFIDSASGDDLDRIGAIFGDTIGLRRGRDDGDYRAYLKSVVRSFVSRGTKNGIKLAISAATDVPIEDIGINEFFDESGYEVVVNPNTPVTGSTLEEIAEIADPSGIEQVGTRFVVDVDIVDSSDTVVIRAVEDPVTEELSSDDNFAINDNAFTIPQDAVQIDDALAAVDEQDKYQFKWEPQSPENQTDWGYAEWVKLLEQDVVLPDDISSANDSVTVDPNRFSQSDGSTSDDSTLVREAPEAETVDDAVVADAVDDISENIVTWDGNTWGNLTWQPT